MRVIFLLSVFFFSSLGASVQPNPPSWPSFGADGGVYIIASPGAATGADQAAIDAAYATNGGDLDHGQFSSNRYAFLFGSGDYRGSAITKIPVGYYTSVIGMGVSPSDTVLPEVVCYSGTVSDPTVGSLNTFWRSAENFTVFPIPVTNQYWGPDSPICMLWAVSQAAPLRRVNVAGSNGNLCLFQYVPPFPFAGFASGGFMADCSISGDILFGPQQQWFTRNSSMEGSAGGLWNMVFVGCLNAPAFHCGNTCSDGSFSCLPYTTVAATPIIAEKPYITLEGGLYYLNIPGAEIDKVGPTQNYHALQHISFTQVFVASPSHSVAEINAEIQSGNHVILTPGIYHLDGTIEIDTPGICILGMGFPTLISNGQPCMKVGSVDGVKVASILFQAGANRSPTLLQWGELGGFPSNNSLYDCFARVGGPSTDPVQTTMMVQINSSNVVGDNFWLWRADHDIAGPVTSSANPCDTAIEVNGDNVTAYALAVEHTLKNMTEWNGNNGRVYFYQSEFPYDVTQALYGSPLASPPGPGYTSYKVADHVTHHLAWGVGVYALFRYDDVTVHSGIITPLGPDIQFTNPFTRFLIANGRILHVLNSMGKAVSDADRGPVYLCGPLPRSNPRLRGRHR